MNCNMSHTAQEIIFKHREDPSILPARLEENQTNFKLTAASCRAAVLFPTMFFASKMDSMMIPAMIPKNVSRMAR